MAQQKTYRIQLDSRMTSRLRAERLVKASSPKEAMQHAIKYALLAGDHYDWDEREEEELDPIKASVLGVEEKAKKYLVRVQHPAQVMCGLDLEVLASSEQEALSRAEEQAGAKPLGEWHQGPAISHGEFSSEILYEKEPES